jgi:hypothetical protein
MKEKQNGGDSFQNGVSKSQFHFGGVFGVSFENRHHNVRAGTVQSV